MYIVLAIEVLLLDPEGALYAAVFVHPVPKGPVMGLKIVAAPGPPAREFALGFQMQIGAVIECVFCELVHEKWPYLGVFHPLNPIHHG